MQDRCERDGCHSDLSEDLLPGELESGWAARVLVSPSRSAGTRPKPLGWRSRVLQSRRGQVDRGMPRVGAGRRIRGRSAISSFQPSEIAREWWRSAAKRDWRGLPRRRSRPRASPQPSRSAASLVVQCGGHPRLPDARDAREQLCAATAAAVGWSSRVRSGPGG